MAPELIQNQSPSSKSDVFSFGILMWAILAKQSLPYPGLHMHTILFKVCQIGLIVLTIADIFAELIELFSIGSI